MTEKMTTDEALTLLEWMTEDRDKAEAEVERLRTEKEQRLEQWVQDYGEDLARLHRIEEAARAVAQRREFTEGTKYLVDQGTLDALRAALEEE